MTLKNGAVPGEHVRLAFFLLIVVDCYTAAGGMAGCGINSNYAGNPPSMPLIKNISYVWFDLFAISKKLSIFLSKQVHFDRFHTFLIVCTR